MVESEFDTDTAQKLDRLRQYHKREEVKIEIVDAYLDEVAENLSPGTAIGIII